MDPNFQKCTFLAFHSIEVCACSLIFIAFMVIEVSPIVIERGTRSVGCLTREKFFQRRQMVHDMKKFSDLLYFNEDTEMRLSVISTPEARASLSKEYDGSESVSLFAHID